MQQSTTARTPSKSVAPFLRSSSRLLAVGLATLLIQSVVAAASQSASPGLAQQIFDVMVKFPGAKPATRPVHAKGIVCEGSFTATPAAAGLSSAAHFQGKPVKVTVRFSDGAPDPSIPDNSPNANPCGIAIRFSLPGGERTDIVAISHDGFIVGSGEDLELERAVLATLTNPSQPHPLPIEQFLGAHPRALKFVQDPNPTPESFASLAFYANNAFVFVNKKGVKQAFRYQILPVGGSHFLDDAAAKAKSPDYLSDDLRARLPKQPFKYHLVAQLPNAGDSTSDGSIVWPDDRKFVELGTITITSVVADSDAAQKALAFDPTVLTDGIELSDDELPSLRSQVYGISAMKR